VFGIL